MIDHPPDSPDTEPDTPDIEDDDSLRPIHDAFFKEIFRDPQIAESQLRVVLPPELVASLDWETLKPAPSTFTEALFEQSSSDLVFHARLFDGNEVLLWLWLEHRNPKDPGIPLRVQHLQTAMWQLWRLHSQDNEPLPTIVPVVICRG